MIIVPQEKGKEQMEKSNCREKCRWACQCDLPGSDIDPYECPRADRIEDYWKDGETAYEAFLHDLRYNKYAEPDEIEGDEDD